SAYSLRRNPSRVHSSSSRSESGRTGANSTSWATRASAAAAASDALRASRRRRRSARLPNKSANSRRDWSSGSDWVLGRVTRLDVLDLRVGLLSLRGFFRLRDTGTEKAYDRQTDCGKPARAVAVRAAAQVLGRRGAGFRPGSSIVYRAAQKSPE